MEITSIDQLDFNKTYSYADYLLWKFQERLELIKGKNFAISPALSRKHQDISFNITLTLGNLFKKVPCKYMQPFLMFAFQEKEKNNKDILTVVQPDLCVICDESKLDDKGCLGAPDLIIEILSPGNSKKEMKKRFSEFEKNANKRISQEELRIKIQEERNAI